MQLSRTETATVVRMPLARLPEPFDHHDWIFEVKYDGFRALAHLEAGAVRLMSRNRNAFKSFPDLCAVAALCIEAESAVIDGEIVYLGGDGRPEFSSLMRRRTPLYFYAFDILWLNGKDLRRLPLTERKQILRTVVPMPPAPILYADHLDEHGVELFQTVCDMDLEGIVAKRKDGLYTPDETSWATLTGCQLSAPSVVLYTLPTRWVAYIVAGLVGSMVSPVPGQQAPRNPPSSASLQLVPPSTLLNKADLPGPSAATYKVPGAFGSIVMSSKWKPLEGPYIIAQLAPASVLLNNP